MADCNILVIMIANSSAKWTHLKLKAKTEVKDMSGRKLHLQSETMQ